MSNKNMWNGSTKKANIIFLVLFLICSIFHPIGAEKTNPNPIFLIVWWIMWLISTVFIFSWIYTSIISFWQLLLYGKSKSKKEAIYNNLKKEIKTALKYNEDDKIGVLSDVNDFNIMLEKNREKIQEAEKEFGRPFMHNLVKMSNFLENEKIKINEISNLIFEDYHYSSAIYSASSTNVDKSDIELYGSKKEAIDALVKDPDMKIEKIAYENACKSLINNIEMLEPKINLFNQLFLYGINMISAVLEKNTLVFYKIYEKLDALEVFNSEWQNKQSMMLDKVSTNLDKLNTNLIRFEKSVINQLENMNNNISKLSNDIAILKKGVMKNLKSVNSKLDYNNLLSTVNTLQLNEIRKSITKN